MFGRLSQEMGLSTQKHMGDLARENPSVSRGIATLP